MIRTKAFKFLGMFAFVNACLMLAIFGFGTSGIAQEQDHSAHQMSPEVFAELREKVPLYREFTDEQIMGSMKNMGPNFRVYLSDTGLSGDVGILALGHGFQEDGNREFQTAYASTAAKHPTAVGLGMAMMTSAHIQTAVDELTSAGAKKILVIPNTTVETGGLTRQWMYIFDMREEAPWLSVDRVNTDAEVKFTPTPTTHPTMSAILIEYAKEVSRDPANEVVALISHGPVDPDDNAIELGILKTHADRIRDDSNFAEVRAFTLQDDAPSAVRSSNVDTLRVWVEAALKDGKRVIVLTNLLVKGSVHGKIKRDLDGLEYTFNEKGLMLHPLFDTWVEEVIG